MIISVGSVVSLRHRVRIRCLCTCPSSRTSPSRILRLFQVHHDIGTCWRLHTPRPCTFSILLLISSWKKEATCTKVQTIGSIHSQIFYCWLFDPTLVFIFGDSYEQLSCSHIQLFPRLLISFFFLFRSLSLFFLPILCLPSARTYLNIRILRPLRYRARSPFYHLHKPNGHVQWKFIDLQLLDERIRTGGAISVRMSRWPPDQPQLSISKPFCSSLLFFSQICNFDKEGVLFFGPLKSKQSEADI